MNHVLKEIKGNLQKQLPSYFDPKIPLHKDLGNIVLTFVQRPQVETKGSESKAQGE